MPDLTMLMKAKIRVLAWSMTVRLKWRKCLAPAVPVSTTVVTPERKQWWSAITLKVSGSRVW